MDRQKNTGLEVILEQLIEHGADDMANIGVVTLTAEFAPNGIGR